MFWGILLLLLGVLMLLSELDIIQGRFWNFFWPALIIAIGVSVIAKHTKKPSAP
ncbi:MAG: DUF5668 domain-containing protein [Candidatus Zixiibacteriota bacterium]